jgi:signal transduction histidine kinase
MKGRWGLQAKMTASFVAITAGAVLITELVILGAAALSPPAQLSAQYVQPRAQITAAGLAAKLAVTVIRTRGLPGTALGTPGIPVTPGLAQPDGFGGVAIPQTTTTLCDLAPASVAVVVSRTGTVLATSYPACFPVGSQGADAQAGAPRKVLASYAAPAAGGSGRATLPSGKVVWAAAPIRLTAPDKGTPGSGQPAAESSASAPGREFGVVYVEVPAAAPGPGGIRVSSTLVRTGLVVLLLAVPAGLVFGLLSTRRLTRRLKRLAASTLEVADGGFEQRIPVTGTDEVARLEENFNRMAGRLQASVDAQRQLAEANARHQERSRIARELHDSISQELFSLSVLAGGLRRALPPGSSVLTEVETMERTAGDTMREMQSLLLALRPVALEEAGLASALEQVCGAYRARLGVEVRAELDPVDLPAALEHAILRVTQEALANAVRHAGARVIRVRLRGEPEQVTLEVADDGRGFDPGPPLAWADGGGLGLRAMRDRAADQGGQLTIDSAPGAGTVVRACFPRTPR